MISSGRAYSAGVPGRGGGYMRLMGKRQLGELQPSELVTTLLDLQRRVHLHRLSLTCRCRRVSCRFLITALEILNSTLVWFCPKYAQLLLGKPVTIIRNGEIQQNELSQLRITASDFGRELRGRIFSRPGCLLGCGGAERQHHRPRPCHRDGEAPPMLPLLIDKAVYKRKPRLFRHGCCRTGRSAGPTERNPGKGAHAAFTTVKDRIDTEKAAPKGTA